MANRLTLLQLAAQQGRLGLCRFLLQESSLFQRGDIVNCARKSLFQFAAKFPAKRAIAFVEEAMQIVATENAVDADVDLDTFTALGTVHEMYQLKLGPSPLANIPRPPVPFEQRFRIAIESSHWHPGFFAAAFDEDEWTVVVTRANEAGKTALHWALEHCGYYILYSKGVPNLDGASGYANLAVELMKKGSDVHSCWNRFSSRWGTISKASPLICFLQGLDMCNQWSVVDLSAAVYRWGQMLVRAGMSLLDYAARENVLLRAYRDALYALDGHEFIVAELEVSGQDMLIVRVEYTFGVTVWKARPTHVPGEWPASQLAPGSTSWLPEIPDTIIWTPEEQDEREDFRWILAGNVSIKAQSYQLEPLETTESHQRDYFNVTVIQDSDGHSHAIQDDELSMITMKNDESFRQRAHTYTLRRSASALADGRRERTGRHRGLGGPSLGTMHQCALDMRWKKNPTHYRPNLRDCLQGRCREQTELSDESDLLNIWEMQLLLDERRVQVAKRFAQRFCPEKWLDTVDQTTARAMERARLVIGPVRPPARS
jgi:hypothetical protein